MCDLYFHTMLFDVNLNWFTAIGLNNSKMADWWQVGLSLASVIIAFATFCLARRVQKAIASNHARQKQVEVMCDLVEVLNNSRIQLSFVDMGTYGKRPILQIPETLNVFEIGCFDAVYNMNGYNEYSVCFDQGTKYLVDIDRFIDNPFTPVNVANELLRLHATKLEDKGYQQRIFVLVNNGNPQSDFDMFKCKHPRFQYVKGEGYFYEWRKLKEICFCLMKVIKEWFKDNGINNCNIRLDYKERFDENKNRKVRISEKRYLKLHKYSIK